MPKEELDWLASINYEHATLTTLAGHVAIVISGPPESIDVAHLLEVLSELHAHCSEHMALEEANGYLAPVRRRRPGHGSAVDELKAEHPVLLGGLAEIVVEVRGAPEPRDLEVIVWRIQRWLADIRSHEDRENMLLLEAFEPELGD